MKKFKDQKEVYTKIVKLQEESCDILQKYVETENVDSKNYIDKLYNAYEEVAAYIFDELQESSLNLEYLIDNTKTHGDIQIIAAFVKAYITDRILAEVVNYEELNEEGI